MVLVRNNKLFLCLSILFLCSCGSEIRVELYGQNEVSQLPAVNFEPIMHEATAFSASFIWEAFSEEGSLYLLYQEGKGEITSECSSGILIDKTLESSTLENLQKNTLYTYEFCIIKNNQILSKSSGEFTTYRSISLEPVYSDLNAINEYIANDGVDIFNSTKAPCSPAMFPGAGESYFSCVHAGLLFKTELPVGVSCSSVKAYDSLDLLHWVCENSSPSIIKSTGLKPGSSLSQLFDENGFLEINLSIDINNTKTYVSEKEIWWTNPVSQLPDSAPGATVTLGNQGSLVGRIYIFSESKRGGSYLINESKVALIGLKGAELQLDSSGSSSLLTIIGPLRYIWVEGVFNTLGSDDGITVSLGSFSRFHNITIYDSTRSQSSEGIIFNSFASMLSDYRLQGLFKGVRVSSALYGNNILYNGVVSNNSSDSINLSSGSYNRVQNLLITYGVGFSLGYPGYVSLVRNITIAKSTNGRGIQASSANTVLFHSIVVQDVNGGSADGFYGYGVRDSVFSNTLFGDATYYTIFFGGTSSNNVFTNNLVISSANCLTGGVGNEGIDSATCAPSGTSDASLNTSLDTSKLFIEAIASDDSQNMSDSDGLILFSETVDLINFESFFRVYGSDTAPLPCIGATCTIWDFKLRDDPSNLAFNRSLDSTMVNEVFLPGQTCPSAVDGNETIVYNSQTFLSHATELIEDGVGDDDFLCESNEECLYNPHYGAYQGEGDYYAQESCIFQDGVVVQGVIMYAHPDL